MVCNVTSKEAELQPKRSVLSFFTNKKSRDRVPLDSLYPELPFFSLISQNPHLNCRPARPTKRRYGFSFVILPFACRGLVATYERQAS